MSWRYLPELAEDYLQADCSVGGQSVPLKSTNIASKSYSKDSETDALKSSQSGMMYEPSMGINGVVESMSLPLGFLASLSALLGSRQAKPMKEMAGRTRREYLAKYDRDTHCWRTSQACLFQDTLEEFAGIWPKSGFVSDGMCCPLPTVEHLTDGNDSGFLPTPMATDWKRQLLSLRYALRPLRHGTMDTLPQAVCREHGRDGGRLNPNWVEWLMGWPMGWTDLKPLGMDKFQQWLSAHGMS